MGTMTPKQILETLEEAQEIAQTVVLQSVGNVRYQAEQAARACRRAIGAAQLEVARDEQRSGRSEKSVATTE